MKTWLRGLSVGILRGGLRVTGETGRRIFAEAIANGREPLLEIIESVVTPRGTINFYCLGDLSLWRARTLLTKEPETIEWIDSFDSGDVFWDVGANIGVYSIYAAISRKVRVLAFEPAAGNYLLINRNIETNQLSDFVQAFCVAFADRTGVDALNMQSTQLGGAMSSFAEAKDHEGRRFTPSFRQGMIGYSIDSYIEAFNPPFPNHLKVDVDGIEDRIIAGAGKTLADVRLKSVSIELDAKRSEYTDVIIRQMEAAGLEQKWRRHAEMFNAGAFSDIYNYLFVRRT
jgi:FkbM family methyltransferase